MEQLSSEHDFVLQNPDISTGALLSKTHEELILLLIQLRRQNDAKERAIKRGSGEIEAIQVCMSECGWMKSRCLK